jgi:hypothetical protein
MTKETKSRPRGHLYVFGIVGVLSVAAGGWFFRMVLFSEKHLKAEVEALRTVGASADAEGCVSAVLEWYGRCEALKSLCDTGVTRLMVACLDAKEPRDECAAYAGQGAKAQYGYKECMARGVTKANKKACGEAYMAIDHVCTRKSKNMAPRGEVGG